MYLILLYCIVLYCKVHQTNSPTQTSSHPPGQVLMGYLGDQPFLNVTIFYNVMTAIAGLFVTFMPLTSSFPSIATFHAGYGFFISANFALTTVILVELLGMQRLTNAFGIVSMSQGIANLLGPPIAGGCGWV